MRHGTPNAHTYAGLIIQSALMEDTGQESDITKESLSSANTRRYLLFATQYICMQLDLLMTPIYAVLKYCRLPIWITAQQSGDGAGCEDSEQISCPTGGTDGGKDQQEA